MTKKTTEIVLIQEAEPPKQPPFPNLFSFFPKLNLQLPFLPQPKPKLQLEENKDKVSIPNPEGPKRNLAWFPKTQVVVPPPLQAEPEPENSNHKTSNPFIIWQVYALGAIIISRWVWARWNERKDRGRSPNDDRDEGRQSGDGLDG
ncbi:hypothetical protein SESBI_04804 [Sesbania bispinosa]|nr:hypothetical protein SESBI_04804 [Sesbania bispinosa]